MDSCSSSCSPGRPNPTCILISLPMALYVLQLAVQVICINVRVSYKNIIVNKLNSELKLAESMLKPTFGADEMLSHLRLLLHWCVPYL